MNSNPQMRNLMDQNPEIRGMLNNPELLRQAMQMARNPNAMQEMMRNHDRAMQNVESIPGGFNHLRRLHEDVIEPMMDATRPQNPFDALNSGNNNSNTNNENSNNSNTETNTALPNPWAAAANTGNNNNNSGNTGASSRVPTITPGLQEAMMRHIQNNPEVLGLPAGASPQMRDQMTRLFGNQEALQAMQRPEVREAMRQIQQGVATINREAPELARAMGIPQMPNVTDAMFSGMGGGLGGAAAGGTTTAAPRPAAPPA